jgi:hypothetical protein
MNYTVTTSLVIEAESPEAAAVEMDRLMLTYRPKDYHVTAPARLLSARGGTVFIRVERGEGKRIA